MSRVCEEFACLPSEAERELNDSPVGYVESLMLMRAYARHLDAFDRADGDVTKLEESELQSLVIDHEVQLLKGTRAHG